MSEEFDIEELLKDISKEGQEKVPVDLFDQIESKILSNKRKKRFSFWIWLGLGLGFGVLAVGLYFGTNYKSNQDLSHREVLHGNNGHISEKHIPFNLVNDETENDSVLQAQKSSNVQSEMFDNLAVQNYTKQSTKNGTTQKSIDAAINNGSQNSSILKTKNIKKDLTNISSIKSDNLTDISQNEDGDFTNTVKIKDTIKIASINSIISIENDSLNLLAFQQKDTLLNTITEEKDILLTENKETDSIPENLTKEQDTLITLNGPVDTIPTYDPEETKQLDENSKFGLLLYGGATTFNIAVFKPYFVSGGLSNQSFESKGYEIGFGVFKQFGKRINIQVLGMFNQKKSGFKYDLMINEEIYFNLYKKEKLISIDNLDNPNFCNCFLAKDIALDYTIKTYSLSLKGEYDFILKPKFNIGTTIGIASNLSTVYQENSSAILSFNSPEKESFNSFQFRFGIGFEYQLTKKIQIGFTPDFSILFAKKSFLYSRKIKELVVPLQLKYSF